MSCKTQFFMIFSKPESTLLHTCNICIKHETFHKDVSPNYYFVCFMQNINDCDYILRPFLHLNLVK